ncbi:MAG: leucyl aminopeptidase [Candidatus Aenigmarchaeota archaeon]|nr:leucyl aminopeptidase [Candidatus Aenigmarchaeota archaeon]
MMRFSVAVGKAAAGQERLLVLPLTTTDTGQGFPAVKAALAAKAFDGKKGTVVAVTEGARRIVLAGLGDEKAVSQEQVRRAFGSAAREAAKVKAQSIAFDCRKVGRVDAAAFAQAAAEGLLLGAYSFDKYKTKGQHYVGPAVAYASGSLPAIKEAVSSAEIAANGAALARDLTNEPAEVMNPEALARYAAKLAKEHGLKCTILDEKQLKQLGMEMLLHVCAASRYKPRLVILEHKGKGKPIALVGKGITFDSGGMNLKPTGSIDAMRSDKAGACLVLAAMQAVARLKLAANVIGVMALAENAIGPGAQRPGDVIKSYSGKTVEINNTDAEGRLVLGDAVAYTVDKYKPQAIIDFATLTGSCVVTFGEHVAALMSNDDKLAQAVHTAGQQTFERCWRMPLYEEYEEDMEGESADIRNLWYKDGRYAGAISGALFIKQFVGQAKWAHLDIAGTAWHERDRAYTKKGATGWGVRLIVELLKSWKQ